MALSRIFRRWRANLSFFMWPCTKAGGLLPQNAVGVRPPWPCATFMFLAVQQIAFRNLIARFAKILRFRATSSLLYMATIFLPVFDPTVPAFPRVSTEVQGFIRPQYTTLICLESLVQSSSRPQTVPIDHYVLNCHTCATVTTAHPTY